VGVLLKFMKSQDQVANIFTKPHKDKIFHKLRSSFIIYSIFIELKGLFGLKVNLKIKFVTHME
jgi:hypothetical protein